MKHYNKILEAVYRGIQLALDDFEDIDNKSSNKLDIIDTDDIIRYKVLLNKFKCFIAQNIYDPGIPIFMSVEEFNEFKDTSLKFNIKYKFTQKASLITAIRNISHFISDANLNFFDVSDITDMSWLFHHLVFNGDISAWDVGNVTNMNYMFGESNFNGDISEWNVSKVKHMNRTFENAWEFNQDISKWDVSNVTDITNMFVNAKCFDQDISNWNLAHIESDTQCMHVFDGCPIKNEHKPKFKCKWKSNYQLVESNHLNLSIDDFDFNDNVQQSNHKTDIIDSPDAIADRIKLDKLYPLFKSTIAELFLVRTNSLIDLEDDKVYASGHLDENIRLMTRHEYIEFRNLMLKLGKKYPVKDRDELKRIIHNVTRLFELSTENLNWLDVSNITDMSYLVQNSFFNADISEWDTSNVTRMEYMFANACRFNCDISKWNTSKVTNMSCMFKDSAFNQDISNWDVKNVTHMAEMFARCPFNQPLNNWNVSKVESMTFMFEKNKDFNQPLDKWDVSNVSGFTKMFYDAQSFCQNISKWKTKPGANHTAMFGGRNFMKRQYKPKFIKK